MRFRPPLKVKWLYPVVLSGLVALGYGVIRLRMLGNRDFSGVPYEGAPVYFLILVAVGVGVCIKVSWTAWTACIDLDDAGVRWDDGKSSGSKKWEEISSLALHGINIALVDRASGVRVPLPFSSRKLYDALKAKVRPLSEADEKILFPET